MNHQTASFFELPGRLCWGAGRLSWGAALLCAMLLLGCSDDANDDENQNNQTNTNQNTNENTNTNDNVNINTNVNHLDSGCPGRLDPVEPPGEPVVVGDGTAASCTAQALADAVTATNGAGGGTIVFDCGEAHTITLTDPLTVSEALTVDGEHAITLSGGGAVRIFDLDHHTDFTLQRITLTEGQTAESGAAIHHPWYGSLTVIDATFIDNHCTSEEGEIGGGAIFAGGLSEAVISGCVFASNSASNGGAILNRGSTLTVVDTYFIGNWTTSSNDSGQYGNGGALYIDGMNYDVDGDFHLCGSVFEANHANQHGSALFGYHYPGTHAYIDRCLFVENEFDGSPTGGAGGLYHQGDDVGLTLTNSTIANNRSDKHAAGLFVGSGSAPSEVINCTFVDNIVPEVGAAVFNGASQINFTHCTFAGNEGDYGPAIFKGENASMHLTSCLFSYNYSPNQYSAYACHATLGDGGGNFQWPETKDSQNPDNPCAAGITFADPLLDPLADNGGPTPTMALDPESPAVGAATDCPATDQRGEERTDPCDSGAYETEP